MSKIIAGKLKGKKLFTPVSNKNIRIASNRFKQGIFETLKFALLDADVLDLYAGIGSLGIEAISRGARSCDFVDISKESFVLLQKNLKLCNIEADTQIFTLDVETFLLEQYSTDIRYDIIFMDPPYTVTDTDKIEDLLYNASLLLNDKGIIMFKHSQHVLPPSEVNGSHGQLELDIQKKYSISIASTYFFTKNTPQIN